MHEPDQPSTCDIDVRVRYAEVDQMGVVHHSRYLEYFEMGRTELLRQGGVSYRQWEERGILLVVVRASVSYHAPARYDDLLVITTTLDRVGGVKIEHGYKLTRKDDGTLVASGSTTLGCIDRSGKIIPLPPEITGRMKGQRDQ